MPQSIKFDFDLIWVRVSGLPLGYLSNSWVMQALRNVGLIDKMETQPFDLPKEPEFRAKMLIARSVEAANPRVFPPSL